MYSFFLSTFCLRFHTYCSEATREAQAREQAREAQGPGSTAGPKGKGGARARAREQVLLFSAGFSLCVRSQISVVQLDECLASEAAGSPSTMAVFVAADAAYCPGYSVNCIVPSFL